MALSGCTQRVVVAGGGASGVLVAAHLLAEDEQVHVTLLDRGWWPGRGLAYATTNPQHLCNAPAGSMSALADRPDHFVAWARGRRPQVAATSFLPRRLFGDYLSATLGNLRRIHPRRLEWRVAEATAVVTSGSGPMTVGLAGGGHLRADRVVVATGNLPPVDPPLADRRFYQSPGYVGDPWVPGALDGLAGPDPVLLIGSGLTAVDVSLTLLDRGQTGPIQAVSRHGLLPRAHLAEDPLAPSWADNLRPSTSRALLAAVRAEVRRVEAAGGDWRTVVDGLRQATPALWRALAPAEQARFLRRLSRLWEVHRHRMAPEVAAHSESLLADGRLLVRAARVEECTTGGGGIDVTLGGRSPGRIRVGRVINCTGPSPDVTAASDPLLDWLVGSGMARPGRLGLGLDVTDDGALVDSGGLASRRLFTIGSLRRGHLWETTAIPEIRGQAAELARTLAARREEVAV